MLRNREGERVPEVTFRLLREGQWVDLTTHELFAGRRVAAFALPGAFTPTCSSVHLPRFDELAPVFFSNGIDEVVCFSVNDTYVMEAWRRDQQIKHVRLVPDGNGDFARGMGMLVEMRDLGFGSRSWRYSMLVNDGVIEKMFIEPEIPGDPYEVSDADTLLHYINPSAEEPPLITLFVREGCPYCARAKAMLRQRGLEFEEIPLGRAITSRSLRAVAGAESVPQVFVDGKHIGGTEELKQWLDTANPPRGRDEPRPTSPLQH